MFNKKEGAKKLILAPPEFFAIPTPVQSDSSSQDKRNCQLQISGQQPESNNRERQSGEGHDLNPRGDETIGESTSANATPNIVGLASDGSSRPAAASDGDIPSLRVTEHASVDRVSGADDCPGGAGWSPPLSNEHSFDFAALYPTLTSLQRASRF